MSGYWDAIERTARGLSGSAHPRARTLFEDDLGSASEGFHEIDTEVEARNAPMSTDMPARELAPPTPTPAPSREHEETARRAPEEPATPAAVNAGNRPDREPIDRPPVIQVIETRSPPPQDRESEPVRPPVKIVELHEVETSRLVVERRTQAGEPQPPAEPMLAQPAPAQLLPEPQDQGPTGEPLDVLSVVPAQPVVQERDFIASPDPVEVPPIIVEIDRIDVRIEAPPPPPAIAPAVRSRSSPAPALGDYLASRSGSRP